MENFLNKIFNSELVLAVRDFFALLGEKFERIEFLHRTPGKKFLIIGFSCVIALLLLVSAVSVISENKEEEVAAQAETTTAVQEAEHTAQATKDIDANFLLALTDNDKTLIHSIIIARFNSAEESMQLTFVEPETAVTVNESTGNMQHHLETGGISQFLWAVSEHTGEGFNRYLIIDEEGFMSLMSMLGETTIEIPSRISYNHDGISFIIDEGSQKLTADMMLKYYIYLAGAYKDNGAQIAYVLSDILERLFTAEDDSKLEERFCNALGYFTTDVSAIDFSDHKDAIKAIPQMKLFEKTVTLHHSNNH